MTKASKESALSSAGYQLHAGVLLELFFPEDGVMISSETSVDLQPVTSQRQDSRRQRGLTD
jgi:hypothetical protein